MSRRSVVIFAVIVSIVSCSSIPPRGCGYRNPDGIGFKISNGLVHETEYGEFPWMTAVLKKEQLKDREINVYQCGGSLIHPQVVLTSANCTQGIEAKIMMVRAGEWDTQTKAELYPDQDRGVNEIVIHKDFNNSSLFDNIALLFLTKPFQIEENIGPICLPPADSTFDSAHCFVTGWCRNSLDGKRKYEVILQKTNRSVIPRDTCQSTLRTTSLGENFELHQSFICAGGEAGKDTCICDKGSPMVCPIKGTKDRYYQAGIFSSGIVACGDGHPRIFSSVSFLRPWIDEQLKSRMIDSSYFTA
ncbi:hypothetical protein ACFFRR_004736 [Megaselia abdita]